MQNTRKGIMSLLRLKSNYLLTGIRTFPQDTTRYSGHHPALMT